MSIHGQRTVRKKLVDHAEDRTRRPDERPANRPQADLGYTLGVRQDSLPFDEPLKTNAEKFVSPQRTNQKKQRMAGDVLGALNYDIKQGTGLPSAFKQLQVGSAELRNPEIS
jgi:hypothetical protein